MTARREADVDQRQGRPMREAAVAVVRRLSNAGFTAYFAGGCVRDGLLGIEPKDYDIATNARPEQVVDLYPNAQTVGMSFGVTLVPSGGHRFDVAAFRSDGAYTDHRHPSSIEFVGEQEDASRRDFTINGLFEDPLADKIIDYVGGQDDLKSRVIRAIGVAQDRFHEDHLRMIRAVRFQARFGFALDEETEQAITALAPKLAGVSRERIGQEILLMLAHEGRAIAVAQLQRLGLDAPALDDVSRQGVPVRVSRLPVQVEPETALAAWLLDRSQSLDERPTQVTECAEALMLSNAAHRLLAAIISAHSSLEVNEQGHRSWDELGMAGQKRLVVCEGFDQALLVLGTLDPQGAGAISERIKELAISGLNPEPLINGDDLTEMGLAPSVRTGQILTEVYDAQLEQQVDSRQAALDLARRLL